MATKFTINSKFKGEAVVIDYLAQNDQGGVIETPSLQTLTMEIGTRDRKGVLLDILVTSNAVLADEPSGLFQFNLLPDILNVLEEGKDYPFMIWAQLSPDAPMVMSVGTINLKPSFR